MDQQLNTNVQQNIQPSPQPQKPLNKTWQIVALVVAGILVVGGVSYGSYYLWQKSVGKVSQRVSPNPSASVSVSSSATPDETANWQTYKNEQYGFEVKYPKEWEIKFNSSTTNTNWDLYLEPKWREGSKEQPGLTLSNHFTALPGTVIAYGEAEFSIEKVPPIGHMVIQTSKDKGEIYARCALYLLEFYELSESEIIDFCNQILSTFKFTN